MGEGRGGPHLIQTPPRASFQKWGGGVGGDFGDFSVKVVEVRKDGIPVMEGVESQIEAWWKGGVRA